MYNTSSVVYGLKHQVFIFASSAIYCASLSFVLLGFRFLKPLSPFSLVSVPRSAHVQARCLVAQTGDTERHRFFVGTNSVREKNEVCSQNRSARLIFATLPTFLRVGFLDSRFGFTALFFLPMLSLPLCVCTDSLD